MQINQARRRYIRWLLATRDLSPHTIRAYEGDLLCFERYLGAGFPTEELARDSVVGFIEHQKVASLSPASLRRRASAARGFCRWLISEDLLAADPWSGASLALGRPRRLPRALPAHELDQLLELLVRAAGMEAGGPPGRRSIERRPHEST
ncbi:MAG TPA: site-specific integrase, partial [Solirubrobacterales bacterium]|nr:site-specific integrase [Solirubrobacterales bacterium]